jgi:peptidoglycan LD-endopeptidase CwlK
MTQAFRALILGASAILCPIANICHAGSTKATPEPSAHTAPKPEEALQRLVKAYPDVLASAGVNAIVWRDGTTMVFDDGWRSGNVEAQFEHASLYYQMLQSYPMGDAGIPPEAGSDPGRVRCEPFFMKMYGDSPKRVQQHLVPVKWLPRFTKQQVRMTEINGVNLRLAEISEELERLPPELLQCVLHPSGTFNWRKIEGTERLSAHAFGIAIDLDASYSDYWRWRTKGGYRNRIPLEIVSIFEKHGFIWGGKWSHFDTMHFEYRPELVDE